jgi:hypothetical protein
MDPAFCDAYTELLAGVDLAERSDPPCRYAGRCQLGDGILRRTVCECRIDGALDLADVGYPFRVRPHPGGFRVKVEGCRRALPERLRAHRNHDVGVRAPEDAVRRDRRMPVPGPPRFVARSKITGAVEGMDGPWREVPKDDAAPLSGVRVVDLSRALLDHDAGRRRCRLDQGGATIRR